MMTPYAQHQGRCVSNWHLSAWMTLKKFLIISRNMKNCLKSLRSKLYRILSITCHFFLVEDHCNVRGGVGILPRKRITTHAFTHTHTHTHKRDSEFGSVLLQTCVAVSRASCSVSDRFLCFLV
ncbi:unnamed protein product [Trichogramma brassicae]|uniref:Uncharacterized protein n=1 Tax=Trichogramma brassicae TaxID=86971 RepID=A0A6H5IQY1_9HYME|nr:unnamed protein product [Trichogramma brassicae]